MWACSYSFLLLVCFFFFFFNDTATTEIYTLSLHDALPIPPRPRNAHKNDFGHLLAVAGSAGKSGAAVLVCEAALRAGAGLVTLAARPEIAPALRGLPEAMFVPLPGS